MGHKKSKCQSTYEVKREDCRYSDEVLVFKCIKEAVNHKTCKAKKHYRSEVIHYLTYH